MPISFLAFEVRLFLGVWVHACAKELHNLGKFGNFLGVNILQKLSYTWVQYILSLINANFRMIKTLSLSNQLFVVCEVFLQTDLLLTPAPLPFCIALNLSATPFASKGKLAKSGCKVQMVVSFARGSIWQTKRPIYGILKYSTHWYIWKYRNRNSDILCYLIYLEISNGILWKSVLHLWPCSFPW